MRALITGGNGFVGRHLAQHLVSCKDDVAVTYLAHMAEVEKTNRVPLPKTVQTLSLDITNKQAVDDVVRLAQPDVIYHLAGKTHVPDAERDFLSTFEVNTFGAINLLDAIVKHSPESRFLHVSSAEVYGDARPGTLPFHENAVLRPINTYGVSKAAADLATLKYSLRNNVHAVRVRPFPHTGPGQPDNFAVSSFAKQLAQIKLGLSEKVIKVGNLEVKRDYTDVSDIVRGYREALLNGVTGEVYNLCSGTSLTIGEILQRLIAISQVEVEIVVDPARVRPADIPDLCGSYQKANKDFGWKPRIDLDATLTSLFAYWVEVLSS